MLTRLVARTPGQVGDRAARHATAAETLRRAQLKSIQQLIFTFQRYRFSRMTLERLT